VVLNGGRGSSGLSWVGGGGLTCGPRGGGGTGGSAVWSRARGGGLTIGPREEGVVL